MRRIKILHVVGSYFPATVYGGPIRSVHQLCRNLAETGDAEVSVYTTNINGKDRLDVITGIPIRMDGVSVTYCGITFGRLVFSADHLFRVHRHLPEFDIVHFHSVFSLTSWYGPLFCRSMGIPYLVTPRGSLSPELIEKRGRFRKNAWLRLFDRKTLEQASAIHVTSALEAEDLRNLGIRPRRLEVIPNGVEDDLFTPLSGQEAEWFRVRHGIGGDEAIVLFLGRINWKKGLDTLVCACGILANDGLAFRLVLAGPDPEGYRAYLDRLARENGIAERIIYTGLLSGEERRACLAASRVVVLPSTNENFGIAAAEGMAMGRPVVVSEGVGIAQDVRESGGGLVVPRDPRALADGIASLLRSPARADELGRRAASFARARYRWPAIARNMLGVYRDILEGRARG